MAPIFLKALSIIDFLFWKLVRHNRAERLVNESELNTKMKDEIEYSIWVTQTLRLVQALLGAISQNFRMVALSNENQVWRLIFVLASESPEDRDEIDDVASEFKALQDAAINYKIEVIVSKEPIAMLRVVYIQCELAYSAMRLVPC